MQYQSKTSACIKSGLPKQSSEKKPELSSNLISNEWKISAPFRWIIKKSISQFPFLFKEVVPEF